MEQFKKAHLGPARCAADLSVGSERGLYVDQDTVLSRLHRPHRQINLMYCYYPNDEGWPLRASVAFKKDNPGGAWVYPYDDYFPYGGGLNGSSEAEVFECMRDVRRHGQDVCLTLTMDPYLSDEHIIAVARDMIPFGRVTVRINHEATGNWFSFNKRADYQTVAAFFVRCCEIFHREAPNCKIVLCLDGCKSLSEEKMVMEDIFTEAARAADVVSVDRYMALHWGYPADICEDNRSAQRTPVSEIYALCKKSAERYSVMCDGIRKPMVLSEFNADGDVTGPYEQAQMVSEFYQMVKEDPEQWLNGITMYQFRDDGRLGLEITDPNQPQNGIEQPLLRTYRKLISEEPFAPVITFGEEPVFGPQTLRYGGFEDADGLAVTIFLKQKPAFFEMWFDGELTDANLMISVDGYWFYKKPGVRFVDLSNAFFDSDFTGGNVQVSFFAPPASGQNDPEQGEGWQENYYYTINTLPRFRIRYGAILNEKGEAMFRITANTTIGELLTNCPQAADILTGMGMHCIGCPSARRETLEEAAEVHGMDAESLVEDLKGFLSELE